MWIESESLLSFWKYLHSFFVSFFEGCAVCSESSSGLVDRRGFVWQLELGLIKFKHPDSWFPNPQHPNQKNKIQ